MPSSHLCRWPPFGRSLVTKRQTPALTAFADNVRSLAERRRTKSDGAESAEVEAAKTSVANSDRWATVEIYNRAA